MPINVEQAGPPASQQASTKRQQQGQPDIHAGNHTHDADRTAKAQGAVYRQVGNIQDAEGKVNANRHNGPNQALRQCARHGIEQCCNVQEIVNSSKKDIVFLIISKNRGKEKPFPRFLY